MKNRGGLSSFYAEQAHKFNRDVHGAIGVYIEREATLTEDMKSVDSRALRCIAVVDMDGYSNENRIDLSRAEALQLSAALDVALRSTEDDDEL